MGRSKNEQEFLNLILKYMPSDRVLENEMLSRHTSFQIGGPADFLVLPSSFDDVAVILTLSRQLGIPLTVLGRGSNVLVCDNGIRGIVMKVDRHMSSIRQIGTKLFVGAGAELCAVSRYAMEKGLTGLEFAVGIPGSLGGAVYMNAGAYDGEMSGIVMAVVAVCPDAGIIRFEHNALQLGYRSSVFQNNDCVICEVELALKHSNQEDISAKMRELTEKRESKQPLDLPSAGSAFKRPPGYFAGTMIEQAGLKGLQIGGARVSDKHAGFIVNVGGATAADVLALIEKVQDSVERKFGVRLEPEMRILGESEIRNNR